MTKKIYFRIAVRYPGSDLMYVYYDEFTSTYAFSRNINHSHLFEMNQLFDFMSANVISNVYEGINDSSIMIHYVYSTT